MHAFMVQLTIAVYLRKNENYLARYIPLFESEIQQELNAQDTVTELLRDNR